MRRKMKKETKKNILNINSKTNNNNYKSKRCKYVKNEPIINLYNCKNQIISHGKFKKKKTLGYKQNINYNLISYQFHENDSHENLTNGKFNCNDIIGITNDVQVADPSRAAENSIKTVKECDKINIPKCNIQLINSIHNSIQINSLMESNKDNIDFTIYQNPLKNILTSEVNIIKARNIAMKENNKRDFEQASNELRIIRELERLNKPATYMFNNNDISNISQERNTLPTPHSLRIKSLASRLRSNAIDTPLTSIVQSENIDISSLDSDMVNNENPLSQHSHKCITMNVEKKSVKKCSQIINEQENEQNDINPDIQELRKNVNIKNNKQNNRLKLTPITSYDVVQNNNQYDGTKCINNLGKINKNSLISAAVNVNQIDEIIDNMRKIDQCQCCISHDLRKSKITEGEAYSILSQMLFHNSYSISNITANISMTCVHILKPYPNDKRYFRSDGLHYFSPIYLKANKIVHLPPRLMRSPQLNELLRNKKSNTFNFKNQNIYRGVIYEQAAKKDDDISAQNKVDIYVADPYAEENLPSLDEMYCNIEFVKCRIKPSIGIKCLPADSILTLSTSRLSDSCDANKLDIIYQENIDLLREYNSGSTIAADEKIFKDMNITIKYVDSQFNIEYSDNEIEYESEIESYTEVHNDQGKCDDIQSESYIINSSISTKNCLQNVDKCNFCKSTIRQSQEYDEKRYHEIMNGQKYLKYLKKNKLIIERFKKYQYQRQQQSVELSNTNNIITKTTLPSSIYNGNDGSIITPNSVLVEPQTDNHHPHPQQQQQQHENVPRGELNCQWGDHATVVQKRSGRPMPVSSPQCRDAQNYRKSTQPQQLPYQSPQQQQQQQQHEHVKDVNQLSKSVGYTLFIRNIHGNVRSNTIKKLFAKYGHVVSSEIREERGFGLIIMSSLEEAKFACKSLHKSKYMGRTIYVYLNIKKEVGLESSTKVDKLNNNNGQLKYKHTGENHFNKHSNNISTNNSYLNDNKESPVEIKGNELDSYLNHLFYVGELEKQTKCMHFNDNA